MLRSWSLDSLCRSHITETMSYAHLSVTLQYSPQFEVKYKRRNFATPKNYLDFLSNYMKFLENNRNSLDQMSGTDREGCRMFRVSSEFHVDFQDTCCWRPLGWWFGQARASSSSGEERTRHPSFRQSVVLCSVLFLPQCHEVTEMSKERIQRGKFSHRMLGISVRSWKKRKLLWMRTPSRYNLHYFPAIWAAN